ncbi:unnamed protein product [Phytophthora fragariaefolia]|uniref:Unnamed protein product n=1 Tax=Phytophthora fragariaefolia TaxID=1490495 RepID=A0A9W6XMU9_9STRA|nr:unnamed protein product [Phytophthora fragariaefolia]
MAQYKTYRFISGISGAGIEAGTNKVSLDPSVWEDLVKSADGITQSIYCMLQRFGFPHVDVCALLAGDSVATGEDGDSLADYASTTANQAAETTPGPTSPSHPSSDSSNDAYGAEPPPSHQQRSNQVKRLRDGRAKAKANTTNDLFATDRATYAFIAACKASEEFFKKRIKQMEDAAEAENVSPNGSGFE